MDHTTVEKVEYFYRNTPRHCVGTFHRIVEACDVMLDQITDPALVSRITEMRNYSLRTVGL